MVDGRFPRGSPLGRRVLSPIGNDPRLIWRFLGVATVRTVHHTATPRFPRPSLPSKQPALDVATVRILTARQPRDSTVLLPSIIVLAVPGYFPSPPSAILPSAVVPLSSYPPPRIFPSLPVTPSSAIPLGNLLPGDHPQRPPSSAIPFPGIRPGPPPDLRCIAYICL